MSVISNPAALNRPGTSGTTTRLIPIVCASCTACTGPLPPNAISVNSRTSRPRCVETALTARAIVELATT